MPLTSDRAIPLCDDATPAVQVTMVRFVQIYVTNVPAPDTIRDTQREIAQRRLARPLLRAGVALGLAALPLLARPWYTHRLTRGDAAHDALVGGAPVPDAFPPPPIEVTIEPLPVQPTEMEPDRAERQTPALALAV